MAIAGRYYGDVGSLTACDAFVEYDIDNQTDQALISWPSFNDCGSIGEPDAREFAEITVAAGQTAEYHRSYAPWIDEPGCVVVADTAHRLVLSDEYEYGRSYSVQDPWIGGDTLAGEHRSPDDHLLRHAARGSPAAIGTISFTVLLLAGIVIGLFLGIRATRKRTA